MNQKQKIADFKALVKVSGHRRSTLEDLHRNMAPRSRNMINPLTGRPFTVIGPISEISGRDHDFSIFFEIYRDGIKGNFPNDVKEFVQNAVRKGTKNRQVNVEILRPVRKVWS